MKMRKILKKSIDNFFGRMGISFRKLPCLSELYTRSSICVCICIWRKNLRIYGRLFPEVWTVRIHPTVLLWPLPSDVKAMIELMSLTSPKTLTRHSYLMNLFPIIPILPKFTFYPSQHSPLQIIQDNGMGNLGRYKSDQWGICKFFGTLP